VNPVSTPQWSSYIDLEEAVEYLQLETALSQSEQTKLQRYIDSACTTAQSRAARPLCPTQFQERHDGWSGEYIQLRYSPFLELIRCAEWQSSGGTVLLPESTPENPIEGIQIDYATAQIMRTFAGYSWPRPFFPGSRNIEVTYVAGFNPLPPDIWEATQELIAWKWRNTQQATRDWAPTEEFESPGHNGLYPGLPDRIATVFDTYWLPTCG
jgi:hypothetical protein